MKEKGLKKVRKSGGGGGGKKNRGPLTKEGGNYEKRQSKRGKDRLKREGKETSFFSKKRKDTTLEKKRPVGGGP